MAGKKFMNPFVRIADVVRDERSAKITGLLLILVAAYLAIAFTSYVFTWKVDQDKVFQFSWGLLLNADIPISNSLGRLGAIVSHTFFYKLFGLSSYLLVMLSFTQGINLVFQKKLFGVGRLLKYSLFGLIWLTVVLSYALQGYGFPFGGAFGNMFAHWLINFLGFAGTGILILFSLLIAAVYLFNINFAIKIPKLPAFLQKKQVQPEFADGFTDVSLPADDDPELESSLNGNGLGAEETVEGTVDLDETITTPKVPVATEGGVSIEIEETVEEKIEEKIRITNYDPTLDLPNYKYPTLDLLEDYGSEKIQINREELERNKDQIVETLRNYKIEIDKIKATVGPTVTLYEIIPAPGVRISKIKNLEDDIALNLAALGIRIIAPIPGKGTVGIEVPNIKKEIVSMRTMLASEKFQEAKMDLPIALGKTISNEIFIADLAKMPHLLMAGATGQGKSVGLNAIITSLLYKKHPSQLKFVLIDPKKVELSLFKNIEKHFLAKLPGEEEAIITDTKLVIKTLNALCMEMDQRYDLLKMAHVNIINEYNRKFVDRKLNPEKGHRFFPYIVLIIDEFADLIMTAGKEVEGPITRLTQLARAVGIHLVIATQRPSVNIITGTIKANFPARIAFKVTAKVDSRTILDAGGAEQLIGRGDMLLTDASNLTRIQCAFVDTPDVERVTENIMNQPGYPETFLLPDYIDEKEGANTFDPNEKDEFFEDAARLVVQHQQGSTSLIQRRMKLGYNRAGRIVDQLEAAGILGPPEGSKARQVLFQELELEQYLLDLAQNGTTPNI